VTDITNQTLLNYQQDIDKKYEEKMRKATGYAFLGAGIKSIAGGFLAKNNYDYKAFMDASSAASARANASIVARSRNVGISEAKEAGSKFVSSQINQMAQSGALVGGAGTMSMIEETDFLVQREISMMKLQRDMELAEGEKQAKEFEADARYEKKLGSIARTAGILQGISSIMSAAGSFAPAKGAPAKGNPVLQVKPSKKPTYKG